MGREASLFFYSLAVKLFNWQRLKASLVHLALSALVFTALLIMLHELWFPRALFYASGGWEGLRLVAAVDLVLGPLLTLVVFDIAKRRIELIRDLSVIAGMQLVCLVAGVVVVFFARPVVVVYVFDTFHVVRKSDLAEAGQEVKVLEKFEGGWPKVLYVESGDNPVAFVAGEILDGLNSAQPKYLNVNLYREFPRGSQAVDVLLNSGTSGGGCIRQNISSVFESGSVCFNPETFTFTDFIAGDWISSY